MDEEEQTTEIEPRDEQRSLADLLPQRDPGPVPPLPRRMPWKRYLLPLLLVMLAVLINVLAVFTRETDEAIPDADVPVAELSDDERVEAADSLARRGDARWTEGYEWINDYDVLRDALTDYKEAWRLITKSDYPAGANEGALVIDSLQCRSLHSHLKHRIGVLLEDLE